jgi:hypothetical protein
VSSAVLRACNFPSRVTSGIIRAPRYLLYIENQGSQLLALQGPIIRYAAVVDLLDLLVFVVVALQRMPKTGS